MQIKCKQSADEVQIKCRKSATQVQGKCTTRITGQTKCTTLSPARPAKRQLVHHPLGLQRHLEQQPTRTLEQFSREQVDQEQNTCQSHPEKRHYTISAAARCVDIQSSLLDCVDIQFSLRELLKAECLSTIQCVHTGINCHQRAED